MTAPDTTPAVRIVPEDIKWLDDLLLDQMDESASRSEEGGPHEHDARIIRLRSFLAAAPVVPAGEGPMTNAEVEQWIDACNHEPARQVLRDYLALRARSSPDLSGGGEAARIIACHLPLPDTPDTVCLPITMTAGDLRTVYTALSPSREGVEPEAGAVGAADTQVGKAVYERIEALVSRNPTPDSSEWAELDYLSHLAESVEEVGGFDGPLAPIYSHPNLAWTWDRAVNLGCQTDEPTLRQMVEHYYRSHSMPDPILWTSKYIEAHPTPADDRLAVAVEALEIVRDGMEASGGWDGDEDVFSAVVEALALLTKSGEAEG